MNDSKSGVTLGGITASDMLDLVTDKACAEYAKANPDLANYPGMDRVIRVAAALGAQMMAVELGQRNLIRPVP